MTDQLNAQVQSLKTIADHRARQADRAGDAIIEVLNNGMGTCFKTLATERVGIRHQQVSAMDPAAVKATRARVDSLVNTAPEAVDRHFGDMVWPHRREDDENFRRPIRNEVLDARMAALWGELGYILVNAGIEQAGYGTLGEWYRHGGTDSPIIAGVQLRPDPPAGFEKAWQDYVDAWSNWNTAARELRDAESQLSQAKAAEAWGD